MSANGGNLFRIGLATTFLIASTLACGQTSGDEAVSVVIDSPDDGGTVLVGQAVMIDSAVAAAAGVGRVDLSIGGQVIRHDTPPEENPTEFRVSQLWTPASEGSATVTVVAYDVNGASDEATITLQVVESVAVVPTAGSGSAVPEPTATTEAGCTLDSSYTADVTIPDGTVMSPGEAFVKTWRVRNVGTCDWEVGFELIFASGAQMEGLASVPLPATVSGAETDVTVNLVAPTSYGTYQGTWRMRSDEGVTFGTNLTVEIEVPPSPGAPTIEPPPATVEQINPPPATSPYTERVTEETTLPGGGDGSITANCPAGGVIVGGGYSGSPGVLFIVNNRSGNGWRVYAVNTSHTDKTIRVYAVCLRNTVGTSVSVEHRQITVEGHGGAAISPQCPAGSVVTAGGWETEYVDVRIQTSLPMGPGWYVGAYNEASSDHALHVYAVCLWGSGGITTEFDREVPIAGGDTGSASVTCPTLALMTGGGFTGSQEFEIFVNSGPWGTAPDAEWRVYGANASGITLQLQASALCLGFP